MSASAEPFRSWTVGALLVLSGRILMLGVPVFFFYLISQRDLFGGDSGMVLFVGLMVGMMFLVGPWMIRLGKRMAQPDPRELLARDSRAPVVFLRPFNEDRRARTEHDLLDDDDFGYIGNLFNNQYVQAIRMLFKGYLGLEDLTLEEELTAAFRSYGPVVAVGKPGERLQTSGAARLYVSDDDWQAEVEALLQRAAIVIWQAGTSAGTWWELEAIVRLVEPTKVLLVIPSPVKRANYYQDLWHHADPVLPQGLPRQWEDFNLVTFDEHWEPRGHAFTYLDAVERFFVCSGLDLPGSIPVFLGRQAKLLEQQAKSSLPLTLQRLAMGATGWLAPLGALMLYGGVSSLQRAAEAEQYSYEECQRNASMIRHHLADPSTLDPDPQGWLYQAEKMRAALSSPDALKCMPIGEVSDADEKLPSILTQSLADLYPGWEQSVRTNHVTAETVSRALEIGANPDLRDRWTQRRQELVREAMSSVLVFDLTISHDPDDFNDFVTKDVSREFMRTWLRAVTDTLTGEGLTVRESAQLSREEKQWVAGTAKIDVLLGYAQYGDGSGEGFTGWRSVPELAQGLAQFSGCTRGEPTFPFQTEVAEEAPERVHENEFLRIRSRHTDKLADLLGEAFAEPIRNCIAP